MQVVATVSAEDLSEMGLSPDDLEESIRDRLSSLEHEGDPIYTNSVDVHVVVTE